MHVRGRMQTGDTPYGGYAGTGKICIQVHHLRLLAPQHNDSVQCILVWPQICSISGLTEERSSSQ